MNFNQTNITDYFPVSIGTSWTYTNSTGKDIYVIIVKNSTPDNNDGTTLYLFEDQMIGLGSTSTMYSIKDNKVVMLVTKDILGRYQERQKPYPIQLAPAGQEWRFNDRGDDLLLKTSKSSCSFDENTYNDCILVEEHIVAGNDVLRTKKSYYAKGIGLVYVTLQGKGEKETVHLKLKSSTVIKQ